MPPLPDAPLRIETTAHRWTHGRFERVTRAPHPAVAPYVVGRYEGFTERTTLVLRRRETAVSFVPLILNLGDAFRIFPSDDAAPTERRSSFAAGLHDRSVLVEGATDMACMQVNLRPLAARRILDVAMHEIANRAVPLDELLGRAGRELVERVGNAPTWEARFAEIDAFLHERLVRGPLAADGVRRAWTRLRDSGGTLRIGDLRHEAGWSHKHFIRRFQLDVGLSPKTAARVIRFEALLRRLDGAAASIRWTDAALACGYYDQAHLIRDFRALAGTTPTEYMASRIPEGGGIEA